MCDCYFVINPSSNVHVSITDPGMTLKHRDQTVRGLVATFYLPSIYSIYYNFLPSRTNFWHHYPKGIDNPFNTSGCEDLLSVCRGCLRFVAWFSYWFDNLGFISKGNTYRCCAASSVPLWGNTNVSSSHIKRNFWRCCRRGSST